MLGRWVILTRSAWLTLTGKVGPDPIVRFKTTNQASGITPELPRDMGHITTAQLPFPRPYIARQEVATARLRQ
jgi:hypothetical protein